MDVAQKQLQAVIVTWRKHTDRAYVPLGRLVSGLRPELPEYEFAFLNGVKEVVIQGLGPLWAFADINPVYRSDELFPFFQNRVMQPSRPDYPEFVRCLALDPNDANPMDILIRTGGGRVTDPFEIFECPVPPEGSQRSLQPYRTHFLAHGISHLPVSALDRINSLQVEEKLFLMQDCQNEYDNRAMALRTADRVIVGYLPGFLLLEALQLWEQCSEITCYVTRVNPPGVPFQRRLLCRMEACWPEQFQPFNGEPFRPISPEATNLWARLGCAPRRFGEAGG